MNISTVIAIGTEQDKLLLVRRICKRGRYTRVKAKQVERQSDVWYNRKAQCWNTGQIQERSNANMIALALVIVLITSIGQTIGFVALSLATLTLRRR